MTPRPPAHHRSQPPSHCGSNDACPAAAALVIAGQRIHVGIVHAGHTLTVEAGDTTWRVYHDDNLVAEVVCTTTNPIARFKVHKPEPLRRPIQAR